MSESAAGTLAIGSLAPKVRLPLLGGGEFELSAARSQGPVVLAFFNVNCPVCQFSFPFLERLAARLRDQPGPAPARVIGVGQNPAADVSDFARKFSLHFPLALDAAPAHAASRAYGLSYVPSVFWIEPEGRIGRITVGFDRADYAQIAQDAGAGPLFTAEELQRLPPRRPG